jgi:cholest-4-en-3-one 26-monooxygenase
MRTDERADLSDVDLNDMDRFQRGEYHHAMFVKLRNTDPGVHWQDEPEGTGYWAVTRLDHLREVNRQPEVFSSNRGGTQIQDAPDGDLEARMRHDSIMLDMDPPKHTRYRKLVNRGFTPRMIGLLEAYLENRTKIIVDGVCEKGECDFVTELASELPLQAIAEMMGIPLEDRSRIFDWTNKMIGSSDPEFATSQADVDQAFAELSRIPTSCRSSTSRPRTSSRRSSTARSAATSCRSGSSTCSSCSCASPATRPAQHHQPRHARAHDQPRPVAAVLADPKR